MRPIHLLTIQSLGGVHLLLLKPLDEIVVEHVAEGSMPEVVAKTCRSYVAHFLVLDLEVALLVLEDAHLFASEVASAYGVLESSVGA